VYDDAGLLLGFRGSHSDITHRKQAEEKLLYLSLHDPLTGVYNRAFFEAEMRRLAASPGRLGLIVGDVDGLKLINDTLGHDSGDQLLLAAARTISRALAGDAVLARIGG
ncbi:MAG: diguanylate cyclase, partial [Negativicutes bacterium]|nr:diguanylate cyclase [Negativicutes bacterium]